MNVRERVITTARGENRSPAVQAPTVLRFTVDGSPAIVVLARARACIAGDTIAKHMAILRRH